MQVEVIISLGSSIFAFVLLLGQLIIEEEFTYIVITKDVMGDTFIMVNNMHSASEAVDCISSDHYNCLE